MFLYSYLPSSLRRLALASSIDCTIRIVYSERTFPCLSRMFCEMTFAVNIVCGHLLGDQHIGKKQDRRRGPN